MAQQNDVFAPGVTLFVVPPGYSLALWVRAVPGEVASTIKYFSGGSLEIMQVATPGSSGILQTAAGQGYLFGLGEAVNLQGPASYYLCATGATALAYCLRGLSTGY